MDNNIRLSARHSNQTSVEGMKLDFEELNLETLKRDAEDLADANLFMNVFVDLFHGALEVPGPNEHKVERVISSLRRIVDLGGKYQAIVDQEQHLGSCDDILLHYFYNNLCMIRRVLNRIIRAVNPDHLAWHRKKNLRVSQLMR